MWSVFFKIMIHGCFVVVIWYGYLKYKCNIKLHFKHMRNNCCNDIYLFYMIFTKLIRKSVLIINWGEKTKINRFILQTATSWFCYPIIVFFTNKWNVKNMDEMRGNQQCTQLSSKSVHTGNHIRLILHTVHNKYVMNMT